MTKWLEYRKSRSNELFNSKRQEICWKRELKVFLLKTLQDDHDTFNQEAVQY